MRLMTFTLATENTWKWYQAPFPIFRTGPGNEAIYNNNIGCGECLVRSYRQPVYMCACDLMYGYRRTHLLASSLPPFCLSLILFLPSFLSLIPPSLSVPTDAAGQRQLSCLSAIYLCQNPVTPLHV